MVKLINVDMRKRHDTSQITEVEMNAKNDMEVAVTCKWYGRRQTH